MTATSQAMRLQGHLTLLANALVSEQPNAVEEAIVYLLATTFNIDLTDADSPKHASVPPPWSTEPTTQQRCSAEEEQLWASLRSLMRNACAAASLTSLAAALGTLLTFARIPPAHQLTSHHLRTLTTARRTPHGGRATHARYARFASILSEGLCIALHKGRQDLADMLLWHGANPFTLQTGAYVRLGEVDESGAYFGTSVAFSATALAIAKGNRTALELLSTRMPFVGWVRVKVYRGADALLKGKKKQDWALRWVLMAPVHDAAGALLSLSLFLFSAHQGDLHSLVPCSVVRFLSPSALQSYGGTTSTPRVQYTLLPLARKGPTVVLDYDDWTAQCVWPDTTALGVIVMGSERFAEDAPSVPTFKSTAGSMHGGNASGKQRVVHEHAFRMHIAPATDTQEAGLLVQQLRGALVEQCRRERSVGGMEGGAQGEDVCVPHAVRAMSHRRSLLNLSSAGRHDDTTTLPLSAPPGGALAATLAEVDDQLEAGSSMHSVSSASGLYAQLMAQQHAPGGALWSPGRRGSWAVATDLAMDDEHMSAETTSRNTLPPAPSSIAASSLLDSSLHGHSMHGQGPGDAKLDISCERTPAQVGSWFGGIINLPARKRRERSIMS